MVLATMFMISLLVSLLIPLLAYLMSYKGSEEDKLTAYECGFNPFKDISQPISMSFWVVGVLFLLFDLEVLFLMPWSVVISSLNPISLVLSLSLVVVLFVGLSVEWLKGGLEWN